MFTGKTSHVGGEKEQKEHKLAEESAQGLKKKFHNFKVSATHLKHRVGKFQNLLNQNHRHDEEHEKETDAKRTRIGEGHRFQSFAPEREGNKIKWYIDGRDYFHAVSVALERATETIYIEDWWLSPELFLRRPPATNQKWRLDNTLKRAAERGVKIYVVVYREVEQALTCNSQHTKKALHDLCPEGSPGYGNIRVMRHPDHNVFENAADMTFYWAHHEKFIVIDYNLAFIGGLDLCFGRWDDHQHILADAHPAGVDNEIFPGQDWNNNRIMDFQSVQDWKSNEVSKADYGRMPWHDVAMGVIGPCIYDIAEHFVLRWNFIKREKYKRDDRYDWLTLTGRTGDNEDLVGVQRPKHPVGEYIHHPLTPLENKYANPKRGKTAQHPHTDANESTHGVASHDNPDDGFDAEKREMDEHGYYSDQHRRGHGLGKELKERGITLPHRHSHQDINLTQEADSQQNAHVTGNDPKNEGVITASGGLEEKRKGYPSERVEQGVVELDGTVHAQLVRSSADWSSGILAESSIQNAYCQVIRDAKHFVYIENQFFITATGENQTPVHNQIGAAIVDACVRAAKENRKFRVIIVMPAIPGFAGDLRDNAAMGTRAIMDYQYKSICRGDHSIYGRIKEAGFDPTEYIFVFNLRSYDRLNKTPALKRQEEKSGVTYQEVQRAQAEEVMSDAVHGSESFEGGGNAGVRETAKEGGIKGLFKKTRRTSIDYSKGGVIEPEDPNDDPEVLRKKKEKFEAEKEVEQEAEHSADSIAKNAMLDQKKPSEEPYIGRDENGKRVGTEDEDEEKRQQELENFVQEELYIHGKLLIVDDRIAICGSSNINDRSQLGFHDSELSIVMEDTTPLESKMNGEDFTAGLHAATLRRMLWREHLGLLPPQPHDATSDPNAQPPGDADNDWHSGDEWDTFVTDPLSEELWKMWTKRATVNTAVFRHIFHADPDDNVKSFEDYDKFLGARGSRKEGHVYDLFQPVDVARKELDKIEGHLVWFPLKFLEEANMAETGLQVNSITESVYT